MTLRELILKFGFELDKNSEKETENSIEGLKDFATKMLGAIAIGFSFTQINILAEEFNSINAQINNSTKGLGDQEEIQQKILAAANETKSSYGDTAKMVSNLVKENSKLFGSVDEAIEFNNAATKLFKTAGKTNEDIAGLMEAINVSFAHGAVDSGTITTLLEQAPEAVELLAKQLGTSSDKLEDMVSEGKISLEQLKNAFVSNSDTIDKNFNDLDYSISDAILNIRNQWGLFCDSLWKGTGITNGVGKLMVRSFNSLMDLLKKLQPLVERIVRFALSSINKIFDFISRLGSVLGRIIEKIGGVENAIKVLAVAAATVWLALNAGKILSFLKGIGNLLLGINLKVLLIVAVVALLFLVIDDFINFMKGNDSVIGALFEKAGIDADKARQAIINAWQITKDFLLSIWEVIKSVAITVFDAIKSFFEQHGEQIKSTLLTVWKVICSGLKKLWNGLKKTTTVAFNGIKKIVSTGKDAFNDLTDAVKKASDYFGKNKEALELLGVAIGTITALVIAYKASAIAASIASGAETAAIMALYAADGVAAIAKGALSVAIGIYNAVAGVATTVTVALTAAIAFLTSPIGLVILAIGALIAIGVLLYNHWDEVKSFAANIWNAIKSVIGNAIKSAKSTVISVFNAIKVFIVSVLSNIKATVSTVFQNIVSSISARVGKIKSVIVSGFTAAINWIKALPSKALTWGADIVDGIAKGITGAIGKITNAVKGVANKITSFLHFSVPDEGPLTEYESWMPDMMEGLGRGIDGSKHRVLDRIKGFASDMSLLMKSATANANTTSNTTFNSSKASIVQNNNFNNTYSGGDMKTQENVSKGMKKSANDATTQLAKGLVYAR